MSGPRRRVLVTGGAGFIGAAIARRLLDEGHEVRVVDLVGSTEARRERNADVRADHHVVDVRDERAVAAAVDGVDAVCHQAAKVGLGVDFGDATDYVSHNDLGTAVLLTALHHRAFAGRIVLASSMVVYGEGGYECPDHGAVRPPPRALADLDAGRFDPRCGRCGGALQPVAVHEDAPTDPRNVYAATKLHQEHLVAAYAREHDAVAVALRYHNVYGPFMPRDTPYAGVASIFRSAIERGDAPSVFEDGGQRRDFVHVDDVAAANVLALTAPEPTGPEDRFVAVNVASGEVRTVLDLASALATSIGGDAAAGAELRPRVVGGYRRGDVRHVFASPERAHRLLGFRAQVPFLDGVHQFAHAVLRGEPARPSSPEAPCPSS